MTKAQLATSAANMHSNGVIASFIYQDDATTSSQNQVYFNASNSSCLSGSCTYAWKFGDNATGSGVTANHIYASAGTYSVTLTVTDSASGATATATNSVVATSVTKAAGELTISGQVLHNSAPLTIGNCTLSLVASNGKVVGHATLAANGSFTFKANTPDTYTIVANVDLSVNGTPTAYSGTLSNVQLGTQALSAVTVTVQ